MSWAGREEWSAVLADYVERHTTQAFAAAGIDPHQLTEVIGDEYFSSIWGAAFEDLVATVLPDGRNLADDYLKRRGWKENVSTREYINGLRHSAISLYEVSGLVPGESMLLRDLVRSGEPIRVFEKSGSRGLRQWDRVATRVITIRGRAVISGTLMQFDNDTSEHVLASLRQLATGPTGDPNSIVTQSGALITNAWLEIALKAAQGRNHPQLMNSDGEPLDFVTVHFPLLPGITVAQARSAVGSISDLRQETASFWNWLSTSKPKGRSHNDKAHTFTTTMDDGSIVLGNVEIKGRRVSLMVNSEARAVRGKAMMDIALSGLVRAPLMERADIEQMLASQRETSAPLSELSPEEERAVVRQMLDNHYRNVIDERIPMLGNRSPRVAVRTAKGRNLVVGWLKTLENHSARLGTGDAMGGYDFGWMWRELGLEKFRR